MMGFFVLFSKKRSGNLHKFQQNDNKQWHYKFKSFQLSDVMESNSQIREEMLMWKKQNPNRSESTVTHITLFHKHII